MMAPRKGGEVKVLQENGDMASRETTPLKQDDQEAPPLPPPDIYEEDELDDFIPTPPDGGYGWVIMVASLFLNILVDGVTFTFGIFLSTFMNAFESTKAEASLIGALLAGVYLSTGIIAGPLTNQFGSRPVAVTGSVLACASFVLATFSPTITTLTLIYGVLGGFGFGLMYLPAVVSVAFYFEKKRAMATGIAVCGSGIGTFLFAPLGRFLLERMEWRSALIILAGILLNGCVFGALLRPLEAKAKVRGPPKKGCIGKIKDRCCTSAEDKKQDHGRPRDVEMQEQTPESKALLKSGGVVSNGSSHGLQNGSRDRMQPRDTFISTPNNLSPSVRRRTTTQTARLDVPGNVHLFLSSGNMLGKGEIQVVAADGTAGAISRQDLSRPLFRKDIFLSTTALGGGAGQSTVKSLTDMRSYVASIASMPPADEGWCRFCPMPRAARDTLRTMMDFSLLKIPALLLVLLANFFAMSGLYSPFMYMTDFAISKGTGSMTAALLVSVIGVANTVGRILSGVIADHPKVNSLVINNVALIIGGIIQMVMPFCTQYWLMVLTSSIFGLCVAAFVSLTSIILVDIVGLDRLTNSFGLLTMVRGISSCIGPPLLGALYDSTGSYTASFFTSGGFFIFGGMLFCILHLPRFRNQTNRAPEPAIYNPPNRGGDNDKEFYA